MPASLGYDVMTVLWKLITSIFFREVRPRGAFNIPKHGPTIFVAAPHANQFLDPLLLLLEVHRETRRPVHFLAAAKSMDKKFLGFFIKLMQSIPVSRAADSAKPGTGLISLSEEDPCVVIGHGTKFTSELSPKMQLLLPKSAGSGVAEVTEVISDTELRLKKEFSGDAKGESRLSEKVQEARSQGKNGIEYKTMPFVDQKDLNKSVYSSLTDGECIGIFPEGGSHDRTDLLPLKAGVAVMALGAMANDPSLQVKICPVGLAYFHPHRFRSRAVIEFGRSIDVPAELVQMFKEGGTKKREASGKLLDLVYEALKTVTVRAPDYDALMVIQAARRLYKTPGQHLTLSQVVELNKRFIEGYTHFKDEPRIQELRNKVLKYNRLVRDSGLRDHQVPRAKKAGWKTFGLLLYRTGLLLAWTVLALPGVVLNGPIFLLASIISRKKAKEAVAASTVKIAGRDVLGSWKVLISMGVTPVLYAFYAAVATVVAIKANAPMKWRILTPFIVVGGSPWVAFAALKFGEAGMDVLKSLRPLIVALLPGQQRTLNRLKAMREDLSNELADVINEYGPKVYEDFDQSRILVPSSVPPPSSGTPGLWRRKSGIGAVDAQGNLLVHPMTWLDERLFGWSKGATRGTSAWEDAPSTEVSHQGTPVGSDDEDDGDYDSVAAYLPFEIRGGEVFPKTSKSNRSSYADLQILRHKKSASVEPSPLSPLSPLSTNQQPPSPRLRKTEKRERRGSLTNDFSVSRIGEVVNQENETLQDATQDLNNETQLRK